MKKGGRILLITAGALVLLAAGAYAAWHFGLDPYRESLTELTESAALSETVTKEEAEEDLKDLYEKLKTYHPAWVDGTDEIPRAVEEALREELGALEQTTLKQKTLEQKTLEQSTPEQTVTVKELWQAAARVAAASGTGHVQVSWYSEQPLYLSDFSGLRNNRLKAVDGITVEELYQTFLSRFSYELESYAASQFSNCVVSQAYLEFLGVATSDGADFTFETPEGEKTVHYEFVPIQEVAGAGGGQEEGPVSYAGYVIEPERDAALLTLTACVDDQAYQDTLEAFFGEVRERKIGNVIVDLRQNGGGNSMVANRFISYLDVDSYRPGGGTDIRFGNFLYRQKAGAVKNQKVPQPFGGDVYVLTSANTFSSAMMFAEMIGDNGIGQIIGETSGNMPESYGDILTFQTPHARLAYTVPYKVFKRIDQTKKQLPLVPDVEIQSAAALDKAYEMIAE